MAEFQAVHSARHQDVGEDQVDFGIVGEQFQRFVGVGNLFDHVTELLEIGGGNLSDLGTVFNYQHRAGPIRRGFGFDARDRRRRQLRRARQIERDHRAAPDRAGDSRSAARLLGEAINLA